MKSRDLISLPTPSPSPASPPPRRWGWYDPAEAREALVCFILGAAILLAFGALGQLWFPSAQPAAPLPPEMIAPPEVIPSPVLIAETPLSGVPRTAPLALIHPSRWAST